MTTFAAQISAAERRYSNTAARRYKNEELIGKGAPFLADTPERVRLWFRRRGLPTDLAERAIKTGNVSLEAQESMAPVGRTEPVALERVLGTTDFLGVAFLERGLQVARTVARIAIRGKTGSPIGYGTGFMVSPRLLMTNNHVLPDAQLAADSIAEFDYFVRADGTPSTVKVFGLEPQTFFCTDETLDFALVAVSEVGANGDALYPIGWNQLIPEEGKAIIGQWVNVIQHPNGEPKQLVLRNNQIVDTPDQFLTYVADTSPGSSGSPVYNDQWEVVALHHAGVPARDAQGRILNLQGQPWQDWMGEHQVKWLANEGARVSRLVAHLNALALTASERALFLQALQRPPAPTPRNETAPTRASTALNAFDPPAVASDGAATWTIPLRITLSLGELGRPSATAVAPPAGGNIIVPAARDGMPRAVPSSEQGILEAARNEFLKRPGVLGVRLGYRFVDDLITTERAIVVTVDSKKSLFELQRTGQSALPQSFNGYQVQVTGPTLRELIAGASGSANEALALPVTLRPEEITYVGADVPLATVNERMKIKLHMSPDAGWPHLKKFLGGTKERLVVGMYDFGAEHILDAILAKPRLKELVLVMQRGESLGKGKGAKKDDLPDADVAQALSDKFGKRFHFGWVKLGVKNGWVANSYHIKVAVSRLLKSASKLKANRTSRPRRPTLATGRVAEVASRCADRLRGPSLFRSSRDSGRHREGHSSKSHQVARGQGQLELLVDAPQAAKHGLPYPADRLAPAEVLLDPLAHDLAQAITRMPCGTAIDGAATVPRVVAGDVGRDIPLATGCYEVDCVVGFVGANAAPTRRGRHCLEHRHRGAALAESVRMGDHGADHQAIAVLHQRMALVAQRCRRIVALAEETGVRIGGARVGVVAAWPALPVGLGIAPTAARPLVVRPILGPEALLARPRLDQRAIDREMLLRQQTLPIGQSQHLGEETFHHLVLQQPVAILGEG